jgi:hypothetical protein
MEVSKTVVRVRKGRKVDARCPRRCSTAPTPPLSCKQSTSQVSATLREVSISPYSPSSLHLTLIAFSRSSFSFGSQADSRRSFEASCGSCMLVESFEREREKRESKDFGRFRRSDVPALSLSFLPFPANRLTQCLRQQNELTRIEHCRGRGAAREKQGTGQGSFSETDEEEKKANAAFHTQARSPASLSVVSGAGRGATGVWEVVALGALDLFFAFDQLRWLFLAITTTADLPMCRDSS